MTVNERNPAFDVEAYLAKTNSGRTISEYGKGEVIYSQGDPADAVFYIREGLVNFQVVSEQGKEAIVAHLEAGSFFGESCLAGQTRRLATAVTTTEAVIMRLEKAAILRVIQEEPAFSEFFIGHLLTRAISTEADLVDQLFNSSEKRLARLLLLLANFGKEGKHESLLPTITHEMLAQMIGTTRPRVSHFMNKFRRLGFIDYNGSIQVHNSLLNMVLHDDPAIRRAE